MLCELDGRSTAFFSISRKRSDRIDVNDRRKQCCILTSTLASSYQAGCVKFVRNKNVLKIAASVLESRVSLEIHSKLFFAIGSNTPLCTYEHAPFLRPHDCKIDFARFFILRWRTKTRKAVQQRTHVDLQLR